MRVNTRVQMFYFLNSKTRRQCSCMWLNVLSFKLATVYMDLIEAHCLTVTANIRRMRNNKRKPVYK